MKAAVFYKYGETLKVTDTEKPSQKEGEVLVKVYAASVNAYDWHLIKATPFFTRALSGLFKPKNNIPGADIAGVVVKDGKGKLKAGDEVFGCLEGCGKGGLAAGGFAEYVCVKESNLALKSASVSFEEAAALPMAAVTSLQAVRDNAKVTKGQSVLVNGASGGVGMFAVQIAKAFGAEVTGVCGTGSADSIRSIGADQVIDYKRESVVASGKQYDVIIDVAATLSVKNYRRLLKPNGICVVIGYSTLKHTISYNLAGKRDGKKIMLCAANNRNSEDLLAINKLIDAGQLRVVIDSRYSLDNAAEAVRRVETGHPKGKVIIGIV